MKNLLVLLFTFVMVSFSACGHKGKDVPSEVKTAFFQKFPDASKVKWEMETEYKIDPTAIPAAVKAILDDEFGEYTIEESEVSETKDGKVFKFELKKGKEKSEVTIDVDGTVLEQEQMET